MVRSTGALAGSFTCVCTVTRWLGWAMSLVAVACGSSAVDGGDQNAAGAGGASSENGGSLGGATGTSGAPISGSGGGGGASSRDAGGAGNAGSGGATGGHDAASGDAMGGPDASAPRTVTACPAGNSAAVGTWVEVTPSQVSLDPNFHGFNTGVNAFAFDPSNTANIYLGTCSQGIYKSTDCGATWIHINTGTLGKDIDGGRNWTIVVDPVDPRVVYSNAGYGPFGLFKSTNGGVDWVQLFGAGTDFAKYVDYAFVEYLAMDPTDHQHLVVSTHATCHGPAEGPICFAESTDAGATWRMIKVDPTMGYEGVAHAIVNRTTWLNFTGIGIFLTKDSGATWAKAFDIGGLNTNGEVYRGDDGTYYSPTFYGVAKSSDIDKWTMIPDSPHGNSLTGDGTTVFVSGRELNPPYFSATGDLTKWANYASPKIKNGSWLMRYDRDHHLLYTSNESAGFWRVQTK